jgi:hypothetical protein
MPTEFAPLSYIDFPLTNLDMLHRSSLVQLQWPACHQNPCLQAIFLQHLKFVSGIQYSSEVQIHNFSKRQS